MIPSKRFDIFHTDWGMLRRSSLDTFRFFYKNVSRTSISMKGLKITTALERLV